MKRRSLSFLLALSMVLSMLGAGSIPVAAAGGTLNAYQTEKNRAVTVDGQFSEPHWIVDAPVGNGSYIGALCDIENLFFALETNASDATLSIGGKQVSATLGSAPTISMGKIAGHGDKYEIAIPLPDLGLTLEAGKQLPLTISVGSMIESYTLVLAEQAMVEVHRGQSATGSDYHALLKTNTTAGAITTTEDGTLTFKYSGTEGVSIYAPGVPFNSFSSEGFVLSFDADFNSLPVLSSTSKRNPAQAALFFFMTNGSSRYDMSFWTNEAGQIMFSAKAGTVSATRKASVNTGLAPGTEQAKNVRVRIMTNAAGDVSLYLNGQLKGTVPAARYDSTTGGQMRFYAAHDHALPGAITDVELRNLFYREYIPGQLKTQTYDGIAYTPETDNGQRDAKAYLDLADIRVDGDLSESQWYMPYPAAHKIGSDAPAARAGFLWDEENLYVGIQTFSSTPVNAAQFSIGDDKIAQADLTTGKATMGDLMCGFQQYEWAIPLSQLGLSAVPGDSGDFALSITNKTGTSGMQGKLTLSGSTVVLGDNCDYLDGHDYTFTTVPNTTMTQANGYYDFATDPALTGNEIYQFFSPVTYEGGAYEFTMDLTIGSLPNFTATRGWRGFCVEIREGLENRNPKLQTRFNLRSDGNANVIMDILYLGADYVSVDTGVDFGQRAVFKMVVTDDLIPSLYVNDKLTYKFPRLNRDNFTISDTLPMPRVMIQAINHGRAKDSNGTLNSINVQMHDLLWTQPVYETVQDRLETALDTISESALLAGNAPDDLKTPLALPETLPVPGTVLSFPVTWSLKDTNTGAALDRIDLTTGQIKASSKPAAVTLTATVSEDGVTASRSFAYQLKGHAATGKIAFIDHDMDPRVGQAIDFTQDSYVYIDGNYNSLVYDQGSAKPFNRITLYDGDNVSRASLNDFGVYISDDNKTYTKVTGWQLHQDGAVYTLYNLNQTARYVKVHSYQGVVDTNEWQPSFYNAIQSSMSVSYETDLLGAKGSFAHKAALTVKGEGKDVPIKLTLNDIGAKSGQYQPSYADFRFTMGETMLAHWQDGKGSFYVRVSAFTNGSAAITAHWGNASAKDIADGEATFEAVYGNVTSHDITQTTALAGNNPLHSNGQQDDDAIAGDGRAFTFPNGDVIVVGNADIRHLSYARSTDGGRTFGPAQRINASTPGDRRIAGFGGFLWDEELGRLYLMSYSVTVPAYQDNCDGRVALQYTDDYGYTWSAPRFLTDPTVHTPVDDTDIIIQNPQGRPYVITYCNGIKLKDADGAGPNVDYVFANCSIEPSGVAAACSHYSRDGGETWFASDNMITMDARAGKEYGISETGLGQLDDGTLYIVARAQEDANDYLYQAFSYDLGKSWSDIGPSQVISTNTSPILTRYQDVQLLVWAGHNSLGGNARQRLPMSLGLSTNNYQSYDKFMNLTLGSELDTHKDAIRRMTQPSISFSPDGNEAFICWTNLRSRPYNAGVSIEYYRGSEAVLIEEFDEMIYGTKGAYDDFEATSWKGEGWGVDSDRDVVISTDRAASGDRSMKITDSFNLPAYATRMIPSVRGGSVGASLFVPSGNTTDFVVELKAGYNYTYLKHTITGFGITPDGQIYIAHDSGKIAAGRIALDTWNDFAIQFDMASGKGTLHINGKAVSELATMAKGNEVTAISIGAPVHSTTAGSHIYVDNFFVTEADLTSGTVNTQFADVSADAWYADAVTYAVDNKLMGGYNATTFGPNDTLSRAMVAQVLYNKEGQPAVSGTHGFNDVSSTQWYNNAITWATQNGVMGGYNATTFGPDDPVTVEQIAVILWNYSGTPSFTASADSVGTHSSWAANALGWAVENRILENVPYDAVTGKATRAQTAQMLMNYLTP